MGLPGAWSSPGGARAWVRGGGRGVSARVPNGEGETAPLRSPRDAAAGMGGAARSGSASRTAVSARSSPGVNTSGSSAAVPASEGRAAGAPASSCTSSRVRSNSGAGSTPSWTSVSSPPGASASGSDRGRERDPDHRRWHSDPRDRWSDHRARAHRRAPPPGPALGAPEGPRSRRQPRPARPSPQLPGARTALSASATVGASSASSGAASSAGSNVPSTPSGGTSTARRRSPNPSASAGESTAPISVNRTTWFAPFQERLSPRQVGRKEDYEHRPGPRTALHDRMPTVARGDHVGASRSRPRRHEQEAPVLDRARHALHRAAEQERVAHPLAVLSPPARGAARDQPGRSRQAGYAARARPSRTPETRPPVPPTRAPAPRRPPPGARLRAPPRDRGEDAALQTVRDRRVGGS